MHAQDCTFVRNGVANLDVMSKKASGGAIAAVNYDRSVTAASQLRLWLHGCVLQQNDAERG
eukprot:COSAG01_NODE_18253_length_1089_cov_0.947475_2_plen_60_part_01